MTQLSTRVLFFLLLPLTFALFIVWAVARGVWALTGWALNLIDGLLEEQ